MLLSVWVVRACWTFLIGIPLYYRFFVLMECYLQPRYSNYRLIGAALISIAFCIKILIPQDINTIFSFTVYFVSIIGLYRCNLFSSIICFSLHIVISFIAECTTVIFISQFGWIYNQMDLSSVMVVDVITAITYIIFSYVIEQLKYVVDDRMNRRLKLGLMISSLSLALCVVCMYLNAAPNQINRYFSDFKAVLRVANSIGIFFPLLSIISIFALVHRLNLSILETENAVFKETKAQLELQYYQGQSEKNKEYQKLRHDLKNHLIAIDSFGQSGDLERQHIYISKLSGAFSNAEVLFSSGHLLVDSILQSKSKKMEQLGIRAEWQLSPLPSVLNIEDIDLCSLLGNVLDNAIEACERIEDQEKRSIKVYLNAKGQHFSMQVVNAAENADCNLASKYVLSRKKKNRIGLGLANCQEIVERYNGVMDINVNEQGSSVEVCVVLPVLLETH